MAVNLFNNGAGGNTWGTAGNWSLGSIPTASDGHVATFDATSPNCTVNASNRVCNNIDFTGYTNTITMTFQISCAGNVTLASGMTIAGTGTLLLNGTACTFTSAGKTWPNALTLNRSGGNVALTIAGGNDLTVGGVFSVLGGTDSTLNKTTSEILICNGGITMNQGSLGTLDIKFKGGTWSTTGINGVITNNLIINGSVTISGTVYHKNGTLSYDSSGGPYTVTTTGSTLGVSSISGPAGTNTSILDTNGINWNNVSFPSTATPRTLTINSQLSILGTLTTSNGDVTFNGTSGFSCATFDDSVGTSARTISFKESVTYTITSSLLASNSRVGSITLFTSAHASTKAILTLVNPADCNVLANFTRIDASGGRTINTFNGTVTNCTNIRSFNDLQTVTSTI
jgi:hypothetical protein